MFEWTIIFLVVAVIAAAIGFSDVASESARIAKLAFTIFFIMFLASLAAQFLS